MCIEVNTKLFFNEFDIFINHINNLIEKKKKLKVVIFEIELEKKKT